MNFDVLISAYLLTIWTDFSIDLWRLFAKFNSTSSAITAFRLPRFRDFINGMI